MAKDKHSIKSYSIPHFANTYKQQQLWNLYTLYKQEFIYHTKSYFKAFLGNQLNNNSGIVNFSHFGSTKHIQTKLNASFLQGLLNQACATLNNYIANIETKFNHILNKSTIKNNDLLHQLRTINSTHTWLFKHYDLVYYPVVEKFITDDFGNLIILKEKQETLISPEAKLLAHKLFKSIIKNHFKVSFNNSKAKVRFPSLNKPRLILDSRLYDYSEADKTTLFNSWLNISTLTKGKRILIPLRLNNHFNGLKKDKNTKDLIPAFNGELGKTVEIIFNDLPYKIKDNSILYKKNSHKKKGFKHKTTNREIKFVLHRKQVELVADKELIKQKEKVIAFDLGLNTLLATSEGELLGNNWFKQLIHYDKQITELSQNRQKSGLKVKSKRYDNLIARTRGFIKSSINRILNSYFLKDSLITDIKNRIKTVVIEKLNFNRPELSRKLNRMIKNFGLNVFKDKLKQLSNQYSFEVMELNPAYSSQECRVCGYVDKNNRKEQKLFTCLCCKNKEHADVHAARILKKRFLQQLYKGLKSMNKSKVLDELKVIFIKRIPSLIVKGIIGRRNLKNILLKNNYFKDFVKTTEAAGVKPVILFISSCTINKVT